MYVNIEMHYTFNLKIDPNTFLFSQKLQMRYMGLILTKEINCMIEKLYNLLVHTTQLRV